MSKCVTPTRVRVVETDFMGVVHHASYLGYFELGRIEWLRKRGISYQAWAWPGVQLTVVEAKVQYRASARFDDALEVETSFADLGPASFELGYRVTRGGQLLAEGSTRIACIGGDSKPARLPETLRTALLSAGPPRGA